MYKPGLMLPLQFFAESTAQDTKTTEEEKVYTAEDLQREGDRRVSQAQKTWEKALDDKLQAALKKQGMSEEDKNKGELDEREKALLAKEQELNKRELTAKVSKDLVDQGLDSAWAETLVLLGDETAIAAQVKKLKTSFDKLVADKVAEALKTGVPKGTETAKKSVGQLAAEQLNAKISTVDPWKK